MKINKLVFIAAFCFGISDACADVISRLAPNGFLELGSPHDMNGVIESHGLDDKYGVIVLGSRHNPDVWHFCLIPKSWNTEALDGKLCLLSDTWDFWKQQELLPCFASPKMCIMRVEDEEHFWSNPAGEEIRQDTYEIGNKTIEYRIHRDIMAGQSKNGVHHILEMNFDTYIFDIGDSKFALIYTHMWDAVDRKEIHEKILAMTNSCGVINIVKDKE